VQLVSNSVCIIELYVIIKDCIPVIQHFRRSEKELPMYFIRTPVCAVSSQHHCYEMME
jgi:hypothetical protein